MRPRGRRSPRNLATALNQGSVVTAPADGDCFFWIVAKVNHNETEYVLSLTNLSRCVFSGEGRYSRGAPVTRRRQLR